MYEHVDAILDSQPVAPCAGSAIGRSRGGRAIRAFTLGSGPNRISLLAGCHADEPVGPRLLRHVVGYLSLLPATDPLLTDWEWWIVPHINPDGEQLNRAWYRDRDAVCDLPAYLLDVVREPPGDDIEFGFPRDAADADARPENRAVYEWWRTSSAPWCLHVSLHGMAFAAGPWFLIDAAWQHRSVRLMERCTQRVRQLGYVLHDVERHGEKGFVRITRGFCTRPDSRSMQRYFRERGDDGTATLFRPSSMETIRSLGPDPLTLVSEMPLFITPGVGDTLGPPDPRAEEWKARIEQWRRALATGADLGSVRKEAAGAGLVPMPIRDQMILQLTLIAAGLEQVQLARESGPAR